MKIKNNIFNIKLKRKRINESSNNLRFFFLTRYHLLICFVIYLLYYVFNDDENEGPSKKMKKNEKLSRPVSNFKIISSPVKHAIGYYIHTLRAHLDPYRDLRIYLSSN